MLKSDAITLHTKHWHKFPVFVWQEGEDLVTEVDGQVIRAKTVWQMDTRLDGFAPQPRCLYFVDAPDYETRCDLCADFETVIYCINGCHEKVHNAEIRPAKAAKELSLSGVTKKVVAKENESV